MKLKLVDGFKIRNTVDVDFGGIGCKKLFPYVPDNEVWLDDIFKGEKDLFVDMYKKIMASMAQNGYEGAKAQFKTNYEFNVDKVYDLSGFYIVDGEYVRNNINRAFKYGGHYVVYDYIPEGEIWIDDKVNRDEMKYIFKHEATELKLMRDKDFQYNDAHDFANAHEKKMRRAYIGAKYPRD